MIRRHQVQVNSKAFGVVSVDEKQKVRFPSGLFGFENYKDYVLLDAEQQPYYWLQSLDDVKIAFVLVNPFLFRPDYELDISDDELKETGLADPAKALVFAIVTIPDSGHITANLQGPLIINAENHLGRQVVLSDPRWKTRHAIEAELQNNSEKHSGGRPC
jgi:flagellar assembly factor FliW